MVALQERGSLGYAALLLAGVSAATAFILTAGVVYISRRRASTR